MIHRTEPTAVTGTKITDQPLGGQTVSGYGGKIPTAFMVRYLGRWRRVYAMVYGNAASFYVNVRGEDFFLDSDTEHALEALR